MEEMAKEIETALKADFPNAKNLSFKAPQNGQPKPATTLTEQINTVIAGLQMRIEYLEKLKETL